MDATSKFTNALTERGYKLKGAGRDRYRGQCPAHQGSDLNLSIAKGDQGVLVRCWSHECHEADIASSVGLRLEDLFDEGRAVYDYGNGHKVVRTRAPEGKRIRQENSPQVTELWHHPESTPISDAKTVVLVEGEKTADAMIRLGASCVSTWPGGSSAVGKFNVAPLVGKNIVIVPDNDEPGEKAAQMLSARLEGKAAVTVWRVPTVLDGKPINDAADLWLAGGTIDDIKTGKVEKIDPEFENAVANAQFQEAVRFEARRREEERRGKIISDTLEPKPLGVILAGEVKYDWLVPGLLERKDRLMITGGEGSGKSWFLRQMSIAIAAGVHPFRLRDRIEPRRVLVIDTENTEQQWSRTARYLTQITEKAGTGNPRENVLVSAGVRIDMSKKADVNQIHRLMDQHRPDVLYIGPLYKLIAKAINSDDDAAPLILALDSLRERGVTLLMEAHAGHAKSSTGSRDLRPRGASALLGWPEFGFGLDLWDEDPSMAFLLPWRGARETREWPARLRRGVPGELPWEVA